MKASSVETSSERAYQAIKERILGNQLIPGQKITYDQLTNILEMSKTPIISALSRLEQEDLAYCIPNRGYFIKELDREEIAGLFDVREILEVASLGYCITNIDEEGWKKIEKARIDHKNRAMEEYHSHKPSRNRLLFDAKFHLTIAECGKNRFLVKTLKHLLEHIYLSHQGQGIPAKKFIESCKEHQMITEGIKQRNLGRARMLLGKHMGKHIRGGKKANIEGLDYVEKLVKL